jgi:hypothetical protein
MRIVPASRLKSRLPALLGVVLTLVAGTASGQETDPAALDAALEWLLMLDNEEFGPTWDRAADLFKTAIGRSDWIDRITAVRDPLGRVVAREFRASEPVTRPAGVPEGDYLVIRFNTSFQNRPSASETVVLYHGPDGIWRVSGYFIRPTR